MACLTNNNFAVGVEVALLCEMRGRSREREEGRERGGEKERERRKESAQ